MNSLTKIFHNEIIKEASLGRVLADRYLNVKFNTKILGKSNNLYNDGFTPTLIINNQELFDKYLTNYTLDAFAFYDKRFYEDMDQAYKTLMTSIWSNASPSDFANPIEFLKRSTDFINDDTLNDYLEPQIIGYSEILKSKIEIEIVKNKPLKETPYSIKATIIDNENDDLRYELPTVNYGISNSSAYIYSIKGKSKKEKDYMKQFLSNEQNEYIDEIESKMRPAIKQNFKETASNKDDIISPEHMSGIMPWHLLVAVITIGIFKKNNIHNVLISDYQFLVRWNGKDFANKLRSIKDKKFILDEYKKLQEKHESDARNTTDKLLRLFRRLDYHFDNFDIALYPQDVDNFMHMTIGDGLECNNDIMREFYSLSYKNKIK